MDPLDAGPDDGAEDDGYTAYMTLKQRRAAAEEARRAVKRPRLGDAPAAAAGGAVATPAAAAAPGHASSAAMQGVGAHLASSATGTSFVAAAAPPPASLPGGFLGTASRPGMSLLEAARAAAAAAGPGGGMSEAERRRKEEADLLAQVARIAKPALVSAKEHAQGIKYTEPLKTDWRPPRAARDMSEAEADAIRKEWHILVQGTSIPPPLLTFADMRFPPAVIAALKAKGVERPTPIQVQGLPVALSGRDMIGIAFTGSGKTITFTLPLVMWALQEEMRMPLGEGEGPVGIILAPARELARQHYEGFMHFSEHLVKAGHPELRAILAVGGEDKRVQLEPLRKGVHVVVATPGRLADFLDSKRFGLDICRYIVLDEGDRMLDMGFDESVKSIFSHFKRQRQTLIFSATMPKKIQDFAKEALVAPVTVNVGRAGAANLDVVQEVEYVKAEDKITHILSCLEKTAPPVLVFAENTRDVDEIQEYLLLKGVSAVSIHGGKSQEDRNESMAAFKAGKKDVLVATDVAAKGLDFPDIQHVINFDMPREIENYVHRIGRTGRCGKTGVATTFINRNTDESILLDLKHLLREAKQRIPPFLLALEDPDEGRGGGGRGEDGGEGGGCTYCGGLGHRITECPKLEQQRRMMAGPRKDIVRGGDY